MNIIAHKSKDGREQSLQEHGQNVAKMAASFAAPFGGEKFAERIGVSHDAGKNTVGFQQYIQAPDKNAKSPHAIIAAALNCQANDVLSAVITEGHHSGLHNVLDTITNVRAAFAERSQDIATAREHFSTDAINQIEIIPEFARKNKVFGQYAFTKMEFSCLTDADYQDTERFMRGYSPRSYNYDSFSGIYDMFRKHIQPWIDKDNKMVGENNQQLTKNEEINHMRTQMMLQCLNAGSNSRKGDIRTLSIPTGGSKTLSSFAYAIAAAKNDKSIKRIIVVIPFNAELINRNHKAIRVYPKPIILEVDSKFAGFTIPGMRVEGVTYEVPTFSALKGAIDAIYWHPGVETIPTAVYIHNPIKKERITQNGYNEGRGQRSRECLVNVRYTIIVYLVQMNTMQEGMNLDKYYEMLTKYINGGCGNKVPYLGIAMDPMNFKLINSDDIKPTQPFNEDLGFMPFTEDYTKPKDPDLVCRHLTIENGIIDFTKGEYFHCYEGLA